MNPKPSIQRMDILSRTSYPKEELYRFVKQDGKFLLDKDYKLPGRGVYVHKDEETLHKVFQKGMLRKYASKEELEVLESELIKDAHSKTNQ